MTVFRGRVMDMEVEMESAWGAARVKTAKLRYSSPPLLVVACRCAVDQAGQHECR